MMNVGAAGEEKQKQVYTIGRASFEIDADLLGEKQNESVVNVHNNDMDGRIIFFDWNEALDGTEFHAHADTFDELCYYNAFYLYEGLAGTTLAEDFLYGSKRVDFLMPDGRYGLYYSHTISGITFVAVSYYYVDTGFVIALAGLQENSVRDMALEIVRTFRLDGMSTEEMAAYANQMYDAWNIGDDLVSNAAEVVIDTINKNTMWVYITGSGANIRSGPDVSYSKIHYANNGDSFPYLGEENGWYKIDVNDQTGYVSKSLCELK